MAVWGATLLLVVALAVLEEAVSADDDCPNKVCSGVHIQKAFQCSGKITEIKMCNRPNNQRIQIYLIRNSDGSLHYSERKVADTKRAVTPNDAVYQAGDILAYRVSEDYTSNCRQLGIMINDTVVHDPRGCLCQIQLRVTSENCPGPNGTPFSLEQSLNSNKVIDNSTANNNMNTTDEQGSQPAGGDQSAAVAALATLLVITVVGCGAAWVVFCALPTTRRRWEGWWASKGARMSYTVREAQDGGVTAEEDYIEPDRAGWDAAHPPQQQQEEDAEYSAVIPRDCLRTQDKHRSLPEAQQGDCHEYSVLEEEDPYREPPNSVHAICQQMSFRRETYNEIAPEDVALLDELGQGEFGVVHRGRWSSPSGPKEAAVKCLHGKQEEEKRVRLLQEAFTMGQFRHPHVVQLYGVVSTEDTVMLVMELLPGGDLRSFLLNAADTDGQCTLTPLQLLAFCQEVAAAMNFLSHKGFIHRDLAARNVLLDQDTKCKIADFGMSRDLEESYYYTPRGGRIPIKWTAPEAILFRKYTTKSDVWSFGMLMYEVWSLGHKPFEDFSTQEVIKAFQTGYCQPPPPGCPRGVYSTMVSCWNPDHHGRPSFAEVHNKLTRDPETLLAWSGEEEGVSPQAATLGAPLSEGSELYGDLCSAYKGRTIN